MCVPIIAIGHFIGMQLSPSCHRLGLR